MACKFNRMKILHANAVDFANLFIDWKIKTCGEITFTSHTSFQIVCMAHAIQNGL